MLYKLLKSNFNALVCILFGFSLLFAIAPSPVKALSKEYRNLFGKEIFYYDPRGEEGDVCAAILAGKDNEEKIWNFLISAGRFTAKQAAGIMGNLQAESGLNPHRVQNTPTPEGDRDEITVDGLTGYGIAQWTSLGRQQALKDLAEERGSSSGDLGIQLEYLLIELKGSGVYGEIQATKTLDDASDAFMLHFEKPQDQSESNKEARRNLGRDILAKYGSTVSSAGPSSLTCEPATGNAASLARSLLNSANVAMDAEIKNQIENMSEGKGACPDVNRNYIIDVQLLRVLVTLSRNNSFTMTSLHRGCTSDTTGSGSTSRHWQGKAADIGGTINDEVLPNFSAHSSVIQKFVNQARDLLPDNCELGVPNQTYAVNAKAAGDSPCTNIFLDTPGTTGATGPHIHIGVP